LKPAFDEQIQEKLIINS